MNRSNTARSSMSDTHCPALAIVVPCYNEQEVFGKTAISLSTLLRRLMDMGKVSQDSRVYFVDDGSSDATWTMIESLAAKSTNVRGIRLTRNYGHQSALFAGLTHAVGDAVVSIDADLQDDSNAIEDMVDRFREGFDVVLGVRRSRAVDSVLKRETARFYYRLLKACGVDIVMDHADYRLLSRKAVEWLKEYEEVNVFLRGIVPQLSSRRALVYFDRGARAAGESKYTLRKMLSLALNGITSFSVTPLRVVSALGIAVFTLSIMMTIWAFWVRLFSEAAVPGWASSVIPIYFLGGIQLLCLGVVGEYVAKVYFETKRRPRFIVDKII